MLTELRDVVAAQSASPALAQSELETGMSCSAGVATVESGQLVANGSTTSSSVLLVGISQNRCAQNRMVCARQPARQPFTRAARNRQGDAMTLGSEQIVTFRSRVAFPDD